MDGITPRNIAEALQLHDVLLNSMESGQLTKARVLRRRFGPRLFSTILRHYPCFLTTIDAPRTSVSIVHAAEQEVGSPIRPSNLNEVFETQYRDARVRANTSRVNRQRVAAIAGRVAELITSEVLKSAGLVEATRVAFEDKKVFVPLNTGPFRRLQIYGDFLVPVVPFNLLISVKAMKARERLLDSAAGGDVVAIGFFDDPDEFSPARTKLLQRRGFLAIYVPPKTLKGVLRSHGRRPANVNNTPFYRSNESFGPDMRRVAGCSILDL